MVYGKRLIMSLGCKVLCQNDMVTWTLHDFSLVIYEWKCASLKQEMVHKKIVKLFKMCWEQLCSLYFSVALTIGTLSVVGEVVMFMLTYTYREDDTASLELLAFRERQSMSQS